MKKLVFVFGLVLAMSVSASAATTNVYITAAGDMVKNDNYWYGHYYAYSPNANPNIVSYYYDGPPAYVDRNWTFMEFALSGVTSLDITSVTLNLNLLSNVPGTAGTANIYHRADSTGATGDANADRLTASDLVDTIGSADGTGAFSTDVTDKVKGNITLTNNWAVFYMSPLGSSSRGDTSLSFTSGDATGNDLAFRPYLQFTYNDGAPTGGGATVPEPASMALLASGLIGVFTRRRKK